MIFTLLIFRVKVQITEQNIPLVVMKVDKAEVVVAVFVVVVVVVVMGKIASVVFNLTKIINKRFFIYVPAMLR